MNTDRNCAAAVIIAGGCLCAASILFRGFDPLTLSLLPLGVASGLASGTVLFPVLSLALLASAAAPSALPWVCLAAGFTASAAGRGTALRAAGFITTASVAWFLPAAGMTAALAASAVLVFIEKRHKLSIAVLAAAFIVSALTGGFPEKAVPEAAIARSVIQNEKISFEIPSLTGSCTEVLLPAPCSGEWAMQAAVNSGGVRDTLPVAALLCREELTMLSAGNDTICFSMSPGDTLAVRLLRHHRAFCHPAVHLSAGGELL
ncbi:hypothetical protein CSA37_05045 [Candidatus Fermentibacteria bacterium]|nr:MAG: hypothetical protein CSA37_10335 [Candidatus Fermentibacteria bacterium]PIE52295.1 MAG: hypothetical protein CSA37_07440 [Candidatus Fermentibacteria bacterium]PIE52790.1 MAG: hypothetical protein CSA37_05045 [Candidatus Fermentibacteria bacterium]